MHLHIRVVKLPLSLRVDMQGTGIVLRNINVATLREGYGLIPGGALAVADGRIAWAGAEADLPADFAGWEREDLGADVGWLVDHEHVIGARRVFRLRDVVLALVDVGHP